jgi:hypothetical protein
MRALLLGGGGGGEGGDGALVTDVTWRGEGPQPQAAFEPNSAIRCSRFMARSADP